MLKEYSESHSNHFVDKKAKAEDLRLAYSCRDERDKEPTNLDIFTPT